MNIKSPQVTQLPCFIDVFAGCGGLSLGLMQAGWKGLFAVEHEENAFKTLKTNLLSPESKYQFEWPDWLPKDPTKIESIIGAYDIQLANLDGKIDMLVGGPPCQGFSSAGKRIISDPRNKLVSLYLEFVNIVKPSVVMLENVRGITSDFRTSPAEEAGINYARVLINSLSDDYHVYSQTLDVSDYGVPQRRRRFFLIAFRKTLTTNPSNPFLEIEQSRDFFLRKKGITNHPVSAAMAISDLEVRRNGKIASRDTYNFEDIAYTGPLTNYQSVMNSGHNGLLPDTRLARHNPEIKSRFEKLIDLCHADGRLNVSISREMRSQFGLKKCAIRVLDPNGPAPTVTSMPDDLIHYAEPRTLTVRETAR